MKQKRKRHGANTTPGWIAHMKGAAALDVAGI